MVLLHLEKLAGISFPKAHSNLRQIIDVCTLKAGVLACNSLLHVLLYLIKKKNESVSYKKMTLNLLFE